MFVFLLFVVLCCDRLSVVAGFSLGCGVIWIVLWCGLDWSCFELRWCDLRVIVLGLVGCLLFIVCCEFGCCFGLLVLVDCGGLDLRGLLIVLLVVFY